MRGGIMRGSDYERERRRDGEREGGLWEEGIMRGRDYERGDYEREGL